MNIDKNCYVRQNINMKGNIAKIAEQIKTKGRMSEQEFDQLMLTIPKDIQGRIIIDKLDDADKKVIRLIKLRFEPVLGIFKNTVKNLKLFYKANLTKDLIETYNGVPAVITKDLCDNLISVHTDARTELKTKQLMGLRKKRTSALDEYDKIYGRKYNKDGGIQEDYFVWNPQTQSMDIVESGWTSK